MNLSETLQTVKSRDREEERMTKTRLELSAKKYNLQKELEVLKTIVFAKRSNLDSLDVELTALSVEVSVLENQEGIVKNDLNDLVTEVISKVVETEKLQENFWTRMNGFVAKCNWFLAKQEQSMGIRHEAEASGSSGDDKIRLLKVEGELETLRLYEKYQTRKMEELKLIKDLLDKDSL